MNNFKTQYALWDEFLKRWPVSRLAKMTLDEYNKTGSTGSGGSFTYWLEYRLRKLGGIGGYDKEKFGVCWLGEGEKPRHAHWISSKNHTWRPEFGATAEGVCRELRSYIEHIASLAAEGKIEDIDALNPPFSEPVKWKIAFLYQNWQRPVIVNVFTRKPLAAFTGVSTNQGMNQGMAALQTAALKQRPAGMGILEFGQEVWDAWQKKRDGDR